MEAAEAVLICHLGGTSEPFPLVASLLLLPQAPWNRSSMNPGGLPTQGVLSRGGPSCCTVQHILLTLCLECARVSKSHCPTRTADNRVDELGVA